MIHEHQRYLPDWPAQQAALTLLDTLMHGRDLDGYVLLPPKEAKDFWLIHKPALGKVWAFESLGV